MVDYRDIEIKAKKLASEKILITMNYYKDLCLKEF